MLIPTSLSSCICFYWPVFPQGCVSHTSASCSSGGICFANGWQVVKGYRFCCLPLKNVEFYSGRQFIYWRINFILCRFVFGLCSDGSGASAHSRAGEALLRCSIPTISRLLLVFLNQFQCHFPCFFCRCSHSSLHVPQMHYKPLWVF